ncbi:biofilm-dependent modulation protein, partial [Escherichia coli]|uniref:biofilm-dependent modulation protein n=1 Tax=Escherichia coli TaxID=562 RepID=UPI001FF29F21
MCFINLRSVADTINTQTRRITMFTYYQAENSTAEPALVNAIEQGLRAQHGVVTEDDILMEL